MNTNRNTAEPNTQPELAAASRVQPAHRKSVAALLSLSILGLGLMSSGCTIGQTRFALGASLLADGATTQSALSRSGAGEGNPVMQKAPIPIMLVLSGVVALVAENQIKNGKERQGKSLYRIASVVHGLAAAWNGYQLTKTDSGTSTLQVSSASASPGAAIRGSNPFAPSTRSRY